MQKGFVTILVFAILIGIFAISNSGVVTIDFVFTEVVLSQAIVIFVCVLLGALLASIFGYSRQLGLNKKIKNLKKENQTLIQEISQLKTTAEKSREELLEIERNKQIQELENEDIETTTVF